MDPKRFEEILTRTLDDGRLSRSEQKALRRLLGEADPDERQLRLLQQRAFEMARQRIRDANDERLIGWLEEVLKLLRPNTEAAATLAEVYFSPGDAPVDRIVDLLESARRQVDVCVFTISDNRISDVIERVHQRGTRIRIITDDEKALDTGSDIDRLFHAGIEVRVDRASAHMHHKFAIFDRSIVLTGSYNWTRSAADSNWENLVVLNAPAVVTPFQQRFDELWGTFLRN